MISRSTRKHISTSPMMIWFGKDTDYLILESLDIHFTLTTNDSLGNKFLCLDAKLHNMPISSPFMAL